MVTVAVGVQWGDEGKGKYVDLIARDMDYVVRYQGGHNAGHTVVVESVSFALQLIPSGVLHPEVTPVIANGVVVDPVMLIKEIGLLKARGVSCDRLRISGNAHLIFPYHQQLDVLGEERLGKRQIGTTRRGIGPAYADKAARTGLRVQDMLDSKIFRKKLEIVLREKDQFLTNMHHLPAMDIEQTIEAYSNEYSQKLIPYITDTTTLLHQAVAADKQILLEGAQGTFLDIDHGTYPYVTSSNPTAGGASVGTGIGPRDLDRIVGVAKAYLTRVGEGPMPTELNDKNGEHLVTIGAERGTVTNRPRRPGWLDMVMLRHAKRINSLTEMALTKLDVLSGLKEIKVCTAYQLDTHTTSDLPYRLSDLYRAIPVYEILEGWQEDLSTTTSFDALPQAARRYIEFIEEKCGVPITFIGVGPARRQHILRHA